jgi:hypothetical protein
MPRTPGAHPATVPAKTPWKECSDVTANVTTDKSHAAQSTTGQAPVIEYSQAHADQTGNREFWRLSTASRQHPPDVEAMTALVDIPNAYRIAIEHDVECEQHGECDHIIAVDSDDLEIAGAHGLRTTWVGYITDTVKQRTGIWNCGHAMFASRGTATSWVETLAKLFTQLHRAGGDATAQAVIDPFSDTAD